MIDHAELQKLSQLHHSDGQMLTIYLPLIAEGGYDPNIELKNLLRQAESQYEKARGEKHTDSIEQLFEEIRVIVRDDAGTYGISMALFANPDDGIIRSIGIPASVRSTAAFDWRCDISQLIQLFEDNPPYCTCLISRDQARIFLGRFKDLREYTSLHDDEVPGQHDQGGWSQARFERHIEDHVHRHFKNVAAELFKLLEKQRYERLVLAGPEEVVAGFRETLHGYVAERDVGDVRLLMEAPINDIEKQSRACLRKHIAEQKQSLIEKIRDEALSDDLGVQGMNDTLAAMQRGQVLRLAFDTSVRSPGVICFECGAASLVASPDNNCPYCGGAVREVENLIPSLVIAAFDQGAGITVVDDTDQELQEQLAGLGGVGALLRFKVEQ